MTSALLFPHPYPPPRARVRINSEEHRLGCNSKLLELQTAGVLPQPQISNSTSPPRVTDRADRFHVSGIPETWKSARAMREPVLEAKIDGSEYGWI
jgi:hypothetical protein